jgi:hypothetical protein
MNCTGAFASLYARVKATMFLRTTGHIPGATERPLRQFRLPALLAVAIVALLATLAGASGAGVSNYQGTLYLDGPPATVSAGSFQLLNVAGPAAPSAPTLTAGALGSGTLAAGNYLYIVVAQSGSARTAGPSAQVTSVPMNGSVTVSNVAVGSLIYRLSLAAPGATSYALVSPPGGITAAPFVDDGSSSSLVLPQADNRAGTMVTGYADFVPGTVFSTASGTTPALVGSISPPTVCTGWLVDAAGGLTVPAGNWTFQARIKSGAAGVVNAAAVARLTVGLYVVDGSGARTATVIPPTDGAGNLVNTGGTTNTFTVSATTSSATVLGPSDHLCVQFWRHQTTGYTSGLGAKTTLTLLGYDPSNAITVHPAPNSFAAASLSSPADGLHTMSIPTLGATYTDAEGDAGNLTIRLCTDAGCSSPQNSGPLAATNGATPTWTPPGPLADGQYWWAAQAQDTLGLASAWTAVRTFYVDNAAPTTNITSSPAAQSNTSSGSFSFAANEPVTGYECRIGAAAFAACSSPYLYGPLADGAHTFSVRAATDLAGNAGTTTNYGWTIDTVPSDTSITSNPSSLSNTSSPSFGLSATEPGSTFECSLDAATFAACVTPKGYSGIADGAHTFQVRAVDPAGNIDSSPASYSWTIDATSPDTTIGPSYPAALTIATGATFDFSSNESPVTFACALDAGAFSSCLTPKTYSGLADGPHTFYVRATDAAANTDPSSASYSWTIDTTPPSTTIGPTMPAVNTQSASAVFDLGSNEPGSTFECRLDGALFVSCATPASYAGLIDGTHTFDVRATDAAGNLDISPATYSWKVDNVAPSTPALTAPADALMTSGLPQLRATFADATAGGDTGTVEFQLCSSSAPAGSACAPIVQAITSSSLSSGGTASVTPAALADGTYHWQARAHDLAGNQSGWSATRSFQLDTSVPTVPAPTAPADVAWVRAIQLSAPFTKPAFAGTGLVEFRLCSDPLCLGIVRSGKSGTIANGGLATWSPSSLPVDGLYYWQARAQDSAGNISAWTTSRTLHLDRVAPAKPMDFTGQVAFDGLTLRWSAPSGDVANYVVFVDGKPWKNFGSTEFEVKMGTFDSGDPRSFSVVAVDLAGNVGTMSAVLVGVPNLVGLTWSQALGATTARGLGLSRNAVFFAAIPMIVTKQDPPAPALTERGTSVAVTLSPASGAPLAVKVKPGRFVCAAGSVLRLRVDLSGAARVRTRLLNGHGRVVKRGQLGNLKAGTSNVTVKLPAGLGRGAYRLMLDATGKAGTAHALVRVQVGLRACRTH